MMKTIFKATLFFFIYYVTFIHFGLYSQNEKNTLFIALENQDFEYFEKVSLEEIKEKNRLQTSKETVISQYGIESVPALIGVFNNKDPMVRALIYQELLFENLIKKQSPRDILMRNEDLKPYLYLFRKMLEVKVETEKELIQLLNKLKNVYAISLNEAIVTKNSEIIAKMNFEFFQSSLNEETYKIIKKMGKPSIDVLIKSLKLSENKNVQEGLLSLISFNSKTELLNVIQEDKLRLEIAESLFVTADQTEEIRIKNFIIKTAEYYFLTVDIK